MTSKQNEEFEKLFKKSQLVRGGIVSLVLLASPIVLGRYIEGLGVWFLVVLFIHIVLALVYYYGFSEYYHTKSEQVKEKNYRACEKWVSNKD